MNIVPKKENENVGFDYEVTEEQIKAHQKKSHEEILLWLEETSKSFMNFKPLMKGKEHFRQKISNGNL